MVKKHLIGLFIDVGNSLTTPDFHRIKKSTELTISMNPETQTFDYIADESPTTELDKYAPSIDQPLTMYENEPDFKMLFKRYFYQNTGTEAHARVMLVYMFAGDATTGYLAQESDCILQISEMNAVDSTLTMNITFGGTMRKGVATMENGIPTFTEGVPAALESFFTIEESVSGSGSGSGSGGGSSDPTDPTDPTSGD